MAAGTYRPDRHGDFETPDPPTGRPDPPGTLTPDARAEWNRMLDRLEQTRALSVVDDAALYQYVQLWSETERIKADNAEVRRMVTQCRRVLREVRDAQVALEMMDKIVKLQGICARHTQQLRQGHMAIRQYLVEFGMTPSARTRVKLPKAEKKQSKLVAFMGGKAEANA